MSARDTMCCSASDLYLSLVIFPNTALAFVFAESIGQHLISLSLPLVCILSTSFPHSLSLLSLHIYIFFIKYSFSSVCWIRHGHFILIWLIVHWCSLGCLCHRAYKFHPACSENYNSLLCMQHHRVSFCFQHKSVYILYNVTTTKKQRLRNLGYWFFRK